MVSQTQNYCQWLVKPKTIEKPLVPMVGQTEKIEKPSLPMVCQTKKHRKTIDTNGCIPNINSTAQVSMLGIFFVERVKRAVD